MDPAKLVFLDERGVDTAMSGEPLGSTTPTHARAPRGQRALGRAPGGHWKRLTILGALAADGLEVALKAAVGTSVVPVEVTAVGVERYAAGVEATAYFCCLEAVQNAAKHSGADKVDVYAEVTDTLVEVFVRDRGAGFDVDAVADDRHGVRGSILNRMARHGGRASIRSRPGDGTEVRLEVTR